MTNVNINPNNKLLDCYTNGDFNLFSLLVDEGQNVNCLDNEKKSLISIIIKNPYNLKNNRKFFDKLIANGVSFKQIGWEEDLLTTCVKHQTDLYYAKKLLKNKININAIGISRENYDENKCYDDDERYEDYNMHENFMTTPYGPPIFEALKLKKIEYFDLFLKNNADVRIIDHNGNSILHFFIKNCAETYSMKNFNRIFKILLDCEIDHNSRDEGGADVLNLMSKHYLDDLFPVFFKKIKDVNINSFDNYGRTPLMHSISYESGLSMVTKSLVKRKANLDAFTLGGYNALMKCLSTENLPTMKFLITNGANIQSANKKGDTVLHCLAKIDDHVYDNIYNKFYNIILKNNPNLLLQKNNHGLSTLHILKNKGLYNGAKKQLINVFLQKIKTAKKKNKKASKKSTDRCH